MLLAGDNVIKPIKNYIKVVNFGSGRTAHGQGQLIVFTHVTQGLKMVQYILNILPNNFLSTVTHYRHYRKIKNQMRKIPFGPNPIN